LYDQNKIDFKKVAKKARTDRNATWIVCLISNGRLDMLRTSKEWRALKSDCEENNLFIQEMYLQFRSHPVKIDVSECDAIYFINSVTAVMGGASKETYTIGKITDGRVLKTIWNVPELIIEREFEDEEENCFQETIIRNEKKTKNREE
jgi:hypothetical protein